MTMPLLILDQHFRQVEELFSPATHAALSDLCEIAHGLNWPMERAALLERLPEATFLVAARPVLSAGEIAAAPRLRAVIEVSGAFQDGLDYAACAERGIEALSCSPGFAPAVAEMALAMILAGARGLVAEHENMRRGAEHWLDDRPHTDFTLFGAEVGIVGYGAIARETARLLAPWSPVIRAHDPWLAEADVPLVTLEELIERSRVLVIAASPTSENEAMIGAEMIARIPQGALVVLISRAHVVDWEALTAAAASGRIRLASDVFPDEPIPEGDPVRDMRGVILSPHRAAAVPGGRQPIGDMILHDVGAILEGRPERRLKRADPARVASLAAAVKPLKLLE